MPDLAEKMLADLLARDGASLTEGQEAALQAFLEFHVTDAPGSAFVLRGAAGTGKTFMIRLLTRFLTRQGFKVALLAPTGRAAKVITRRTSRYASTIHRYIYSAVELPGGGVIFERKENKDPRKMYYIVDEASMLGDQAASGDPVGGKGLLSELIKFIYKDEPKRRMILVGDPNQLPPVGSSKSPGLDAGYLRTQYRMRVKEAEMTEVLRQEAESEILRMANLIRASMAEAEPPALSLSYGGEVEVLQNGQEALELYTGLFESDNPDKSLFITYSNKLAVDVNRALRHQLFETEEPLVPSELLMVVRNNYAWGNKQFPFIANGEMGIVRAIFPETLEEKYGLKWMDVELEFRDLSDKPVLIECKVVLDLLDSKSPQLQYADMQRVLLERRKDFAGLSKTRRQDTMRKDPYINALQVKYGYAITGHKSQGGQWEQVIIGFEPMYSGMNLRDYLRWTYTAFTRASERLYILGFPFMEQEF